MAAPVADVVADSAAEAAFSGRVLGGDDEVVPAFIRPVAGPGMSVGRQLESWKVYYRLLSMPNSGTWVKRFFAKKNSRFISSKKTKIRDEKHSMG